MPFNLDIRDDQPLEIRVLRNQLEILAVVPIGHDSEISTQYSIHVALIRVEPFDGIYKAELMFDIVEAGEGIKEFYDNGLETKDFLCGPDREVVLRAVCDVAHTIIAQAAPHVIVMTTSQSNLPGKALVKYGHISSAIRQSGYHGGEADPYRGQRIWMFVKREDVS